MLPTDRTQLSEAQTNQVAGAVASAAANIAAIKVAYDSIDELNNKVDNHESSNSAHASENITYNGSVSGASNVQQAIDGAKGAADSVNQSLSNHVDSNSAHAAEHIAYSGSVIGASNAKQALESVKAQLDQAIMAGDSGPEAAAAHASVSGETYDTLADRLDAEYLQKADRATPIDPDWSNWSQTKYAYGFDKTKTRIFNTFNGVLETDTMVSVRGGKGRWNSVDHLGSFVNGGHVFEGWSADETFRLTIGVGKRAFSGFIQVFNSGTGQFGTLKIGSDNDNEGYDFGNVAATFNAPVFFKDFSALGKKTNDGSLDITGGTKFGAGNRDGGTIKLFGRGFNGGGIKAYIGDYADNGSLHPEFDLYYMNAGIDTLILSINRDGRATFGGSVGVGSGAADPTTDNGRFYFNSTTSKIRACENGVWRDIFPYDISGNRITFYGSIGVGGVASDPTADSARFYFNTTTNKIRVSENGVWRNLFDFDVDANGRTTFNGSVRVGYSESDPTVENGRIYYNSSTNKFRVCENGAWKNMIA